MDAVDLGVNLFVALFALVDPIGNIPIFAAATAGASLRQRLSVSALICIFIVLFLCFFFFTCSPPASPVVAPDATAAAGLSTANRRLLLQAFVN